MSNMLHIYQVGGNVLPLLRSAVATKATFQKIKGKSKGNDGKTMTRRYLFQQQHKVTKKTIQKITCGKCNGRGTTITKGKKKCCKNCGGKGKRTMLQTDDL